MGIFLQSDLGLTGANGKWRASIPEWEWVGVHQEQVGEAAGRVEEGWERGI